HCLPPQPPTTQFPTPLPIKHHYTRLDTVSLRNQISVNMSICIDMPSAMVLLERFNTAMSLLMSALKENTEPFTILAERYIDPLLRGGQTCDGQPAEYHASNMVILASSLAMSHIAAKNMVAASANGYRHGGDMEEVQRVGEVCARLDAFINDKLDREMKRRYYLSLCVPTKKKISVRGSASNSKRAVDSGNDNTLAIKQSSTNTTTITNITNISGSSTVRTTNSASTPSDSTDGFEMVEHSDAATATSTDDSEDWELL
ncbi:hypothetical protein QBC39DRAFT_399641, partial [Podospora conica]